MIRSPFPLEQELGLCWYASDAPGTGGVLRTSPEDFVVRERSIEVPESGSYLLCRLTKRDWDQQQAIREISRRLGVSHRRISWAGTKDKRAVTTQLIAIYDVSPEEIEYLRIRDIDLEVLGRAERGLSLGDLEGNEFDITIRDCDTGGLQTKLEAGCSTAADGMPNYYGIQRFGAMRPVTHLIGRLLLKGDLAGAVETYIGLACPDEPEETRTARQEYAETGDVRTALQHFPTGLRYERAMLHHLQSSAGDYRGALAVLPPKLLSMFVSAYQSFLFNHALSERLGLGLGLSDPVPGDLLSFVNGREEVVTAATARVAGIHASRGRCAIAIHMPGSAGRTGTSSPAGAIAAIMEEDGIRAEDFAAVSDLLHTSFAGASRAILLMTDVAAALSGTGYILSFRLGPGQYATTVCREFMKADPLRMV